MSSFVLRSGYAELAKKVHSISGSVTTVFLFTRLWARSTQHGGLWRDDYILIAAWACLLVSNGLAAASPAYGFNVLNGTAHSIKIQFTAVCFMDIAIALSKTAFATTLLRLTQARRDKALLWLTIALVNSFNLAMVVVNWLEICETRFEYAGLPGRCVSMTAVVWIHTGNAISCLLADVILAIYPWRIIRKVQYVSDKEKWSVAMAMGLVGLSLLVGIVKIVLMSIIPSSEHGKVDYTYGVIAIGCAMQGEAAVFIVAQTIPVIRVLLQSHDITFRRTSKSTSPAVEAETKQEGSAAMTAESRPDSIGLVQLPTGRIVKADSEEGKAFQSQDASRPRAIGPTSDTSGDPTGIKQHSVVAPRPKETETLVTVDDEVHRIWEEMGLSRRAWSKSPSPEPRNTQSLR